VIPARPATSIVSVAQSGWQSTVPIGEAKVE